LKGEKELSLKKIRRTKLKSKSRHTSAAYATIVSNSSTFEKRLEQVDPSDLKADFDFWPSLAIKTWSETIVPRVEGEFDRIVFAGMGGSGLSGELFVDLARETKSNIGFETIKDYHVPSYVDERTLIVAMSSSGNTEETLSVLSEAHKMGLSALTLGSGGLIESLSAEKWGYPFVKTSMLKVPRSSLPGIFYPALKVLVQNGLLQVSAEDVKESVEALSETRVNCMKVKEKKKNLALNLAHDLTRDSGSFPLIYSSNRTRAVGLRSRQSINENAKIHAFDGQIPELCHNDIVGWDFKSSLAVKGRQLQNSDTALLLRLNEDDPVEVHTRFDIVRSVVEKNGGTVLEAPYVGRCYLARILSMLYFLDYASYYMAIILGTDPVKTPSIALLKQELAKRLNYVGDL
jgi:glucose/mannose-6-phosphate isomerase